MIRIVFVVPLMAPYAIPRYKELAKDPEIEVHVVVENDTSSDRIGWKFQEIDGVRTHLLGKCISHNYKVYNREDNYQMNKRYTFSVDLRKCINNISPDVVIACNSMQLLTLIGNRNYKLIAVVEDTLRAAESRGWFKKKIKKLLLKQVDYYMPFTKDAESFLINYGINDHFINTTWSMDVEFFSDLSTKEKKEMKRKELGLERDFVNFVIVANLIPRKGIEEFLNGWRRMSEDFQKKSRLYILGEGMLKDKLKKYTHENSLTNVYVMGNKNYQNVSWYLQCADVFVLPTLEDLCSLAVLEAMAARCPILTTVYNGARQFVEESVNGYIFDPLQEKSIIDVLEKISNADLNKMSKASGELIKNYSTEKVMHKMGDDIKKIFS